MRSFPTTDATVRTRPLILLLAGAGAMALCAPAPVAQAAIGRPTLGQPKGVAPQTPGIKVAPRKKIFLAAYVEYQPTDCSLISSGAWTIDKAPKYGTTITETLNTTLSNGDCPGVTFPFAALYYRWPGGAGAGKKDQVEGSWTSPDFVQEQSFDLDLIRPIPVKFKQDGPAEARAHGVLHFNYKWESSTGVMSDIADCQIGENVVYPGGDPFVWPKPPYDGSTPNPTILWVPASDGAAQDNHSPKPFVEPYKASRFKAKQDYRYQCPAPTGIVNFTGWTDILITRTVADSTGKGCWGYTINKMDGTATETPLPHVKDKACKDAKTAPAYAFPNSAAELSLSASPAAGAVGAHEPVYADLKVENRSGHDTGVDLGLNLSANLKLEVRAPNGQVETARLPAAGFGRSGEIALPAGGSTTQRLLLNDWASFTRPGTYQVSITLMGPTADRPHAELAVQILPRDAARLAATASGLAARALDPDASAADHIDAARALGRIDDPAAVASLVQVLQHGPTLEAYAIGGLARIRTPEALAALIAAADRHPDAQVRAAARSALKLIDGSVHAAPTPAD